MTQDIGNSGKFYEMTSIISATKLMGLCFAMSEKERSYIWNWKAFLALTNNEKFYDGTLTGISNRRWLVQELINTFVLSLKQLKKYRDKLDFRLAELRLEAFENESSD